MSELNNSVVKSLEILELFMKKEQMSVAEMHELSGFSKSAINRIVTSFESKNYIYKNAESGKYLLGNKLFYIGQCTNLHKHLIEISKESIERLSQKLEKTITLSVLDSLQSVVVYKQKSTMVMGVVPDVGSKKSLNCSASGKAIVAFSPNREKLLASMSYKKYSEKTIVDRDEYKSVIQKVREEGFAYDDEELEKDLFCVAKAILSSSQEVICTLSVSGYKNQMIAALEVIKKELSMTVEDITKLLN